MNFRYHPLLSELRCNEDGSEIIFKGEPLRIHEVQLPHTRGVSKYVLINRKKVTVIRIVCECWHGISKNLDQAARRVDEQKGDHYSNLYWGARGMTLSAVKGVQQPNQKMSMPVYREIVKKAEKSSISQVLKEYDISENRFYQFRKKYVKSL